VVDKSQIVVRGVKSIYQWLEKRYKAIFLPEETRDKAQAEVLDSKIEVTKKAVEIIQKSVEWKMGMYKELGILSDKIEEIQKDVESGTDPLTIIQSLTNKGAIQVISTEIEEPPAELPPNSKET